MLTVTGIQAGARVSVSVTAYSASPLRMTGLRDNSRRAKSGVFINLYVYILGHCLAFEKIVKKSLASQLTTWLLTKELMMLHYSVVFLVIALIAAIFGFGGIAAGAVEIAKILFFIFAILALVSFVVSLVKKN